MPSPFKLCGGHPALDLVNTLDNRFVEAGPLELLPSYGELLRFLHQARLLTTRTKSGLVEHDGTKAGERTLQDVRDLRESVALLCYSEESNPADAALKQLERMAIEADAQRELVRRGPSKHPAPLASWNWKSAGSAPAQLPLWLLARSAVALLTSGDWPRVSWCRSDTCRWLFLDSSKNHSRRWCDMALCGNRMKARRFQAKQTA